MIRLNLEFDYPDLPMAFALNVNKGEKIALIGESGAGKSTLLNLIAGFEQASRGTLWLNGENHFATEPAKRPVSMLFQDNNVFWHLTVKQNIGLGLVPSLRFNGEQRAKISEIAEQMGIGDLLEKRAENLSGGQKQRVALARTLLRAQPILLLDEPFSALDPARRSELQTLLADICQQRDLTLLMVTHQLDEMKNLFDYALKIEQGTIVERISTEK